MDKQELKSLVTAFGELITAAAKLDSDKDGKIELTEIFSFVQTLVMKVAAVYGSFPEAMKQFKDVKSAERKELIVAFADSFNLENNDAEEVIEEWLFVIDDIADAVVITKRYFDIK
jgi:hypothetical protein